jgi:hypothetical protein
MPHHLANGDQYVKCSTCDFWAWESYLVNHQCRFCYYNIVLPLVSFTLTDKELPYVPDREPSHSLCD